MAFSKKFVDAKGREWVVDLPWSTVKRLKIELGLSLDDLIPKATPKAESELSAFAEVVSDGMRLFDILWVILKPEAESRGLNVDQFGEGFNGDVFIAAAKSFAQAIHDFFPNPLRRAMVLQVMVKVEQTLIAMTKRFNREMDQVNVETEVNRLIDQSKSGSTTTPALSESTPAPTLSAN